MKRAKKVFEREGIFVQPYPVDFKSNRSYKSLCKNPLNFMPNLHFYQNPPPRKLL